MALFIRALLAVATIAAAAVPASADAEIRLACTFDSEVQLSPGLTLGPAVGEYSGSGTIECVGTADGETVNDEGAMSYAGTGGVSGPANDVLDGDSCVMGSGPGRLTVTLETESGTPVTIETDFDFVRLGVVGYATAEHTSAVFQFVPETGKDCVFSEIRTAHVTGQLGHVTS